MHASGTFEVKMAPQPAATGIEAAKLGRLTIDKQFRGELEAHSLGEMLAAGTEVAGSAGYVAIERVTGSLHGRSGSFVLQHSGTMNRGEPAVVGQRSARFGYGRIACPERCDDDRDRARRTSLSVRVRTTCGSRRKQPHLVRRWARAAWQGRAQGEAVLAVPEPAAPASLTCCERAGHACGTLRRSSRE